MKTVVAATMGRPRLQLLLLGVFAGIALVLAGIGLYGLIARSVAQRTREIGIRVALGAQPHEVIGLVVREGMGLAGMGVALGLVGAVGATRAMSSLLYGVSPTDFATLAVAAVFLGGVALTAIYLPARGATRVDPVEALRRE